MTSPGQSAAEPIDEMVNGRGEVRPHWRGVLGAITALEQTVLADRVRRLAEAAAEDGPEPSWRCDPVPLPLTGQEFALLEAGLVQRAQLLDALLDDLYGPQEVLAKGWLPPAAVFANPGFLRPCRTGPSLGSSLGSSPDPGPVPGRRLHVYAADLVRGPDGQWRVLADRTGGAPGIGYTRETRRVLARVMPELFRTAPVRQLRPFFEAWQDMLVQFAPTTATGRAPVVAMLTPGPTDPHWPEHLALSRDLNCALVEARDLTVRAGVLSIKTLGGLQRVDVLLRRVAGAAMDPLELDEAPAWGAAGGVAGLLDAARSGTVRILNHPGAGLVEAPMLAAFLPALCRHLLNAALLLPTVPTLWLAEPGAVRTAAQGHERWNIGPAFDGSAPAVPLPALSTEARAAAVAAVGRAPWAHVGSHPVQPSHAPCVADGRLVPQPVALRMFLVHDGAGWHTMPGGLARVLSPGEHVKEALPRGAVLKDVWVFADEGGTIQGPEPARQAPLALRRGGGDLPSRVADDFFWLGRYVERLDAQARLARAALVRRGRGLPLPREVVELGVLQRCLYAAGFTPMEAGLRFEDEMRQAVGARGALRAGLVQVALLVEALRDRMTVDTHGAFSYALRTARLEMDRAAGAGVDALADAMGGLQRLSTTVSGVAAEGMVRGGGRLFLDLGRRLERAAVTAYVLGTVLDQPPARMDGTLRLALELCDSAITYRSRYLSVLQPAPVLDLVLADAGNPRALAFQFAEAAGLLEATGDTELAAACSAWQGRAGRLVKEVQVATDQADALVAAADTLIGVGNGVGALSDRITRRFFALLPRLQSVGLEIA